MINRGRFALAYSRTGGTTIDEKMFGFLFLMLHVLCCIMDLECQIHPIILHNPCVVNRGSLKPDTGPAFTHHLVSNVGSMQPFNDPVVQKQVG